MHSAENSIKVALVLLVFDEIEGVKALLPDILKAASASFMDEVFAIDGGSRDGTVNELVKHGVLVHEQVNPGRGSAIIESVFHTEAEYLVFFSPDGNEDWRDLGRFRPYFEEGYDMVIASRMTTGSVNEEDNQIFRPRKWANNIFNYLANKLFRTHGVYITDTINGFRGVRKAVVEELSLDAQDYTIEYQMSIRAMKRGYKMCEFSTHEGQRIGGMTKALAVPTGISFLRCLWREIIEGRKDKKSR